MEEEKASAKESSTEIQLALATKAQLIDDLNSKIEELQNTIEEQKSNIKELSQQKADMIAENQSLKESLSKSNLSQNDFLEAKQKEIDTVNANLNTRLFEIETMTELLEKMKAELGKGLKINGPGYF